ncbi:unnamed protein product, partial [Ectocarpus sp. 6 AP-2014]
MRRLFRIHDVDRDGLLRNDELNAFQFHAFRLLLSDSDLESLRKILGRLASEGGEDVEKFVQEGRGGNPKGFTEEGFLRLIQLFIDKKQMKAPWQAMSSHHYDEELVLVVPSEMTDPPPGKANAQDQVLSPQAHKFLLELFKQFSEEREGGDGLDASPPRLLAEEGQAKVFSVIPDPTCAPWDPPRSLGEEESSEEEGQGQEEAGGGGAVFSMPPFARLGRAPGAGRALTAEGWIAHWQMLALHSPVLLRSHLFYVGFGGHAEEMLVDKSSQLSYRAAATTGTSPRRSGARGRQPSVMEVFVLGSRGCGKSRLIKGLRLGDDLRSNQQPSSGGNIPRASATASGGQASEQGPSESGVGLDTEEGEEASPEDEAFLGPGGGSAGGGGGGGGLSGGEEDWEMVAEAEVPETCCGFAVLAGAAGSPSAAGFSGSSSSSSSYGSSLSVAVTEVPESYTDTFVEDQAWRCDLALLVFDPSSRESIDFIMPLLADIPQGVPRLLVSCESSRGVNASVVRIAQQKCKELELSPVVAVNPCTGVGLEGDGQLRQKITGPVCKGMLPFEERHRKADRNRKIYIAVAALAVAAGLVYAVSSSTEQSASAAANLADTGGSGSRGAGWESGVGGALRAPMRAAKRAAAAAADYWRRWRS